MAETPETTDEKAGFKGPSEKLQGWLSRIKTREKAFMSGWWKAAEEAVRLYNQEKYSDQKDTPNPYNILYSNTEVLKPSLYSATPKPDVRGRFVENPVSPLTKLVEHLLIVFSDPANPGEESLDNAMDETVTSSLVAGMGFTRLRLYPDRPVPLCTEAGHYKGLIWPAGRKWSKLPWIAFRHEMRKEEIFAQFKIPEAEQSQFKLTEDPDSQDNISPDDKNPPNVSIVYELWVKESRDVYYLCEEWEPLLLTEEKDPLKLQGFFPTPGLLLMTKKPGSLNPTPLYQYYRNQAEELNRVTARLNKVLSAIKVRGAYNAMLGTDMQKILSDDDMENTLVPASESVMLSQGGGGFDRHIWLLPIEKLVEVATQLYVARQQIKQVIYEITGLSDIIRGSSVASETATAQNLKNKWGSIRLRDMQKSTAGYVRDIYRLTTDAAAKNVPADKWKAITQAPIPTEAEQKIAKERVEQLVQRAKMMAEQAAMTGQQPQIPPPPPELMQAAQSPDTIESLLKQIASDANRTFTINVQSDSTIDLDTATDKQEVAEFMNAMGQLLAGLQPLAQLGPSGLNAGKEILVAVCSRFKFGLSIIDSLKALQPPPPAQNGPTPEQEKKEKELEQAEKGLEGQKDQLKALLDQIKDAKRDLETAKKDWEADIKIQEANQRAAQADFQATQKVAAAEQQVGSAKREADFVKQKTDLTSATAQLKGAQKVTKSLDASTAPVKQGVESVQKTVDGLSQIVQQLAQTVSALQQDVKLASRKPKRVTRKGDSFVPEYE